MDVEDLQCCVREATRVLNPGGKLVLSIVHPANRDNIIGEGDGAAFVVDGAYFESTHSYQKTERDGVRMVFSGYQRPFSDYTRALEDAGLLRPA
jgi:hypothetical protein